MGGYSLLAHADNLEEDITRLGIRVVLVSAIALFILVMIAGLTKNKNAKLRLPLFLLMTFTIIVSTGTLFGSTIYLNVHSESGGPVHWHADYEVWACGNKILLRSPSGLLSNKTGTSTLHDHGDERIHLEGVVVNKATDATLGNFLKSVGGSISSKMMSLPMDSEMHDEEQEDSHGTDTMDKSNIDSFIKMDDHGQKSFVGIKGQKCAGQEAAPQVFVYQFNKDDDTYSQSKLETPGSYVIRDESQVPPGDCIIMEFAPEKPRTDKLCEQYGIRDKTRCEDFGVSGKALAECNIEEVAAEGSE